MTTGKVLALTRRVVSLTLLILMTVGFVSSAAAALVCTQALEKIQLIPMALAGFVAGLIMWAGVTLLFGRIYCSTVCPMGTLQDIFGRLWRLTPDMARKHRYAYTTTQLPMQISWTAAVAAFALLGQPLLLVAFDPWSMFSRTLVWIFGDSVSLAAASTAVRGASIGVMATLIVFFPVIIVGALRGRSFCNTFCPAGGALAVVSKFAVMKIDINTDLCVHCNRCVDVCKSRCINPADSTVDTPRCVVCFNCVAVCPNNAITYTPRRHRLSTPMMMSTSNNMKITSPNDETISSASRKNTRRRGRQK